MIQTGSFKLAFHSFERNAIQFGITFLMTEFFLAHNLTPYSVPLCGFGFNTMFQLNYTATLCSCRKRNGESQIRRLPEQKKAVAQHTGLRRWAKYESQGLLR